MLPAFARPLTFYESFTDTNPAWSISLNPRINPTDATTSKPGFAISDPAGTNRLFIDRATNNVGIGTVDPRGALDVQANPRTGTHPTNRIMYVTGDSQEADGIEFRHSNGTQGIGFGYDTIYATGSSPNQDLKLAPRGTGNVIVTGHFQAGNSDLYFTNPSHNHTGFGNTAGYAAIENDGGTYGALMILGRAGTPHGRCVKLWDYLEVNGELAVDGRITAANSDLYFTNPNHNHTGFANQAGYAAIENGANYGGLMILGRTVSTNPLMRVVKIWDYLEMNGNAVKPGGGGWGVLSDQRLKKNIGGLQGALDKLLDLHGVTFEWNEPEKHLNQTGNQIGLVAQEVEKVFPQWIGTDPDGFKFIDVRGFEALVIEALRELKGEINALGRQLSQAWPPPLSTAKPSHAAEQ